MKGVIGDLYLTDRTEYGNRVSEPVRVYVSSFNV